ncbi:MAG: hypothetical protein M3153_07475, partial [Chloroflexota bacterium]|nr:hypothetical protein [Chloroflexota bacterium]
MTVSVTAPACTADTDKSCPSVRIWVDIVPGDNSACQPSTCIYGSALVYVDELGAGEDDRFCDDPNDP